MSFEPELIEDDSLRHIHPAVDMDNDDEAFFGTWFYCRIPTPKGVKYGYALYIISSNREMFSARKPGEPIRENIVLKYMPVRVHNSWSLRGVREFLNGYTPNPVEVYNTVKNEIKRYVDFYDKISTRFSNPTHISMLAALKEAVKRKH